MGYKVKWVEDHLGISRKALRNYERLGLMPPNKGGKYRDYSDDINVNIKMYIFDHLRMYIFAILPLDRYIFLSDKIFL